MNTECMRRRPQRCEPSIFHGKLERQFFLTTVTFCRWDRTKFLKLVGEPIGRMVLKMSTIEIIAENTMRMIDASQNCSLNSLIWQRLRTPINLSRNQRSEILNLWTRWNMGE